MISTRKGVEKILGRKGRRCEEKKPTGKGGKDLRKEKGEALRGGKALGGKGGKDLNRERAGKILGRKGGGKILGRKGRRSGRKGLREERGERISTGKEGKDLREGKGSGGERP